MRRLEGREVDTIVMDEELAICDMGVRGDHFESVIFYERNGVV